MVLAIYFLLLLAASVEDSRTHTVQPYKIWLVWLLGMVHIVLEKENRWVTLALTCICFVFLLIVYRLVIYAAKYRKQSLCFGGADVKLIPGMLLVQGWDVALFGIFLGLLAAMFCHLFSGKRESEIPLVPWMSAGCLLVELIYLFSEKSVL